jgi:2-polyprenyl-3-methyl-5-hydroxy-6-metoxy-1,4-benzoquinol methylase
MTSDVTTRLMNHAREATAACPVCAGPSVAASEEFEGYIEGYRVVVLQCVSCDLRYSSRLDVPPDLYDIIYTYAPVLPGYDRYARYAATIRRRADALDILAAHELPYWFVTQHVRARLPAGATIIDLGCGEGYLTYALRQAGYSCIGVDLSADVIDRARRRFGQADWFGTVEEFGHDGVCADLVIAVELIEHVADPVRLVRDASAMLKPGGSVLITTPNRDASPLGVWDTDLPPVHLYWFGRTAMTELAKRAGCRAQFIEVPASVLGAMPPGAHRDGTWPPLLTATRHPSLAVRQARSFPWRARRRLAGALTTMSTVLARSPMRRIPPVAGDSAPTLGVWLTLHNGAP